LVHEVLDGAEEQIKLLQREGEAFNIPVSCARRKRLLVIVVGGKCEGEERSDELKILI